MALIMLATTHRVAAGLLSWRAWQALRSADRVLARSGQPQLPYLREAGVAVEVADREVPELAAELVAAAASGTVVWVADPDGDEPLMRRVGELVVNAPDPVDVEVLHGSYDLPGARLLDLVSVMDTLRRECPWDRKQTHATLVPYLLEEAYELADTVEDGDYAALREELGDVLMQVAFHARVAEERTDETRFTIDDVAAGIVDKLVRRHPHVFGDVSVADADEVNANWEQIKQAERAAKGGRPSVLDGVAMGQPALSLAAQLCRRAARADAPEDLHADLGEGVGAELFALARRAQRNGTDPEAALRAVAREYAARIRAWESRDRG
ncbi:MazG family protein [Thermomonospora cellulosilytica]|uniref:XTP/dITP diphosphohydrolase n=1 Tax=Thermomonospora cellulosilytica TaxID=1411118 RepID=A0A7W3R8H3_9ACTN|nr:MazG family protein [Thermomonospora cellulosilytica]MBA9003569.1 XTP/dITP diphosphohydrolase [Thermomonospora cellulosilytica]